MKIQDVFVPIKSEFTPCIICCRLCYCQEYLWTSYCNIFFNGLNIMFRGKKGQDKPTIFKRGVWTQHKITHNYIKEKILMQENKSDTLPILRLTPKLLKSPSVHLYKKKRIEF